MNQEQSQAESATKEHQKKVTVTVDHKSRHVESGAYIVSAFKAEVKVDAALELDKVVDGQFLPLDNDATIEIQGGEVFVSHVPSGGSS